MTAAGSGKTVLLRILCVVALVCLAFVHQPPEPVQAGLADADLSLYTLPDGTVPTLCLPDEDGSEKQESHWLGTGCEVCRLSASILLPEPVDQSGVPAFRQIAVHFPLSYAGSHRRLVSPNILPRGPPGMWSA